MLSTTKIISIELLNVNSFPSAERIPLSSIVLETDCPYMAPEPHRGTRNDSRNIPYVIAKIAEIKGVSVEEVEQTTRENAFALFTKVPR